MNRKQSRLITRLRMGEKDVQLCAARAARNGTTLRAELKAMRLQKDAFTRQFEAARKDQQ